MNLIEKRIFKKESNNERYDKKLKKCPICGTKAIVYHDIVDGFDFGFTVGCPLACIDDGIHGFNDYESFENAKLIMHYITTKEDAIIAWNKRCEEEE